MSTNARITAAAICGSVWAAIGVVTTIPLPEPLEPILGSPAVIAWLQALAGVAAFVLLWSVAKDVAQQEKAAKEALRIATESNKELQRRVENAEAKLTLAIDEAVFANSPALGKIEEELRDKITSQFSMARQNQTEAHISMMRDIGVAGEEERRKLREAQAETFNSALRDLRAAVEEEMNKLRK